MRAKLFLLSLFSFFYFLHAAGQNTVFAQSFYKDAYIVQNQDTVLGKIEWTDDKALSLGFKFKAQNDTTTQFFDNTNLKAFGFVAEKIHFRSVPVSIRYHEGPKIINRFAKVWLLGYTEMYKVSLQFDEHLFNNPFYYVIKRGEEYYTLSKFKTSVNGKEFVQNRYQAILQGLFQDCSSITPRDIETTYFHDESIYKLVSKYNACKSSDASTQRLANKSKAILRAGVEATGNRYFSVSNDRVMKNQGYNAGIFFDVMEPDISRNFSTVIGLNLNEASLFSIPFLLQHNFTKTFNSKISPFVNAGVTNALAPRKIVFGAGTYVGNLKVSVQLNYLNVKRDEYKTFSLGVGYAFLNNRSK